MRVRGFSLEAKMRQKESKIFDKNVFIQPKQNNLPISIFAQKDELSQSS